MFVFKLVGMCGDKSIPESSLHCLEWLFMGLLIWMFVLGVLDWSSSCHQQHSMNKKCQILRKTCVHVHIFLNGWNLIWKHSVSKIHSPFNGCIHISTVLSKRVHSLFWCRLSPAVSSKPYPLLCSKADRMTKKTLVLTNFVYSPFWLPKKHLASVTGICFKVEEIKHI